MQEIIDYCFKPRTTDQIAKHLGLTVKQVQGRLRTLTRDNLIIRRETDVGTAAWRRWYVTQKPADPVNLSKKYSKNIMGVWL
jgi:predicted ArsR family transcriptional regulator